MKVRRNIVENLIELQLLLVERPRTQRELIEHFGVNRKTVRRAIDRLSLYYPVTEERDGRCVVYSYGEFESPIFTPTEIAALVLAQEAIKATGRVSPNSPFAASAESLLVKVREKLSPFLREKLDSLSQIYGSATISAKDFSAHAATIETLTTAAEEKRRTILRYHTLAHNQINERKFDPFAIYFDPDGATLKVIGFDHNRQAVIPFSIDHIKRITLTKESFARPADFSLRNFLEQNCFNGIHGGSITVRLKAYGVTARIFAERQFHPSQKIISELTVREGQEDETTIEMCVASGRGLERFVLSWMPDVEVLAPIELRRKIAEIQRAALQRNAEI